MEKQQHHQYVIIGGGISGLQAALILGQHSKDFTVLEAQQRIGGRICTLTIGQALNENIKQQCQWLNKYQHMPIDCGATWICEDHTLIRYFCKMFQCKLIDQNYKGKSIFAQSPHKFHQLNHRGQHFSAKKQIIRDLIETLSSISQQITELQQKQQENIITQEQKDELSRLYSQYDNQSAFDFIKSHTKDTTLSQLLAKQMCTLEGGSPTQFSVITLIQDNIQPLTDIQCYAGLKESVVDGYRMKDGMSLIYKKFYQAIESTLAKSNKNIEDYIKIGTAVKQIKHKNTPVEIFTEDGRIFTANKVIVSLPIATFHKIKCDNLSSGKSMLLQNQIDCKIVRMSLFFKTPFWRPRYSGYATFSPEFAVNQLIDISPDAEQFGVLLFVFAADGFQRWTDQINSLCVSSRDSADYKLQFYEKNKEKILEIVANLFLQGNKDHSHLEDVAIFWKTLSDSPYIKSTYQSLKSISLVDKINKKGLTSGSIQNNQENMIIIGSDFSEHFNGYMEGGLRIARERLHEQLHITDPLTYLYETTSGHVQKQ